MAVVFGSPAQQDSRYKRLKRFFRTFKLDLTVIACLIFKWFVTEDKKVYLTTDRTNLFLGKSKINVFMLSIAYEGQAIPIFWQLLSKAGNSNFEEQKALIKRFIETFGVQKIEGLLANREFSSGIFFNWLNKREIPFYIRIKEGSQVRIKGKKFCLAKKLFNYLNPKTQRVFHMDIELFGQKVFLAGSRSERGELMIVATNPCPKNAIVVYLRRWEIENLFQSLKGRGFHFEETHVTAPDRLEKTIALLAIGFCWAHKVGEWRALKKPIVLNRHRENRRPQYSYFRYGLDLLQTFICTTQKSIKEWRRCFQLIDLPTNFNTQEEIL